MKTNFKNDKKRKYNLTREQKTHIKNTTYEKVYNYKPHNCT